MSLPFAAHGADVDFHQHSIVAVEPPHTTAIPAVLDAAPEPPCRVRNPWWQ